MATQIIHGSVQVGDGSSAGGGGTIIGGGGGGGGTTTSPIGVTVVNPGGASLADIRTLELAGLQATPSGPNRATLGPLPSAELPPPDVVISGGAWVIRDLTPTSYTLDFTAGIGILNGRTVVWPAATVTCPAANGIVYVDEGGVIRTRTAGSPETLPPAGQLMLARTYVDIPTYGARIYAVAESRTYDASAVARAPLFLRDRVVESRITSGAWAGATALNATGDINWYFANLGLYPFVEELPAQVLDHLNVQIAKFASTTTGTGATDWTTLHGTTHTDQYQWWYDVRDPRGTPTKARADSHDSYCATFLRLAVRYARLVPGGLTWWDANITAIQEAIYRNHLIRQRAVHGGAGYLNETFQDPAVYPFCQTLDNIEVYRGLVDALTLMTERGGTQATWAAGYSGTAPNILLGIQAQWNTGANSNGDIGWLSVAWDNGAAAALENPLELFYPHLTIGVPAAIFDVPLSATPSDARARLIKLFDYLNTKAPRWFASRNYDLFPWGMLAAAAAKVGFRDIAAAWLSFVQQHQARDSEGRLYIHDIGWARYVERVLGGEVL